jgi:hypothetical protein
LHKEQLIERNRLASNPNKPELKQIAQELKAQGMSFKAIADKFTIEKVPTLSGKSNKWYAPSIRWLINS